jgi:hypothetical protein
MGARSSEKVVFEWLCFTSCLPLQREVKLGNKTGFSRKLEW